MEADSLSSGNIVPATILVTNDDGIDAPGLRALVQALLSSGHYVVRVCAPDKYVVPSWIIIFRPTLADDFVSMPFKFFCYHFVYA